MNSNKTVRLVSRTITKRSLFPWFLLALALANGLLVYWTCQLWDLTEWTSGTGKGTSTGRESRILDIPRVLVPIEDVHLTDDVNSKNEEYPPLSSWEKSQLMDHHSHNNNNKSMPPKATTQSLSTTTPKNVSFCLLIKDDNDILNEWIAYHYHLWNLRQLIVAVDPSSATSPIQLLQQWQEEFGLAYQIWDDTRYMPDFFLQGQYELVPRMIKFQDKDATKWKESHEESDQQVQSKLFQINNHRYRQSKFLQHCAKAIQGTSTTSTTTNIRMDFSPQASLWMTHIDTDEYIALNPLLFAHSSPIQLSIPIPTKPTSGSLLHFLQRVVRRDAESVNWPCISMPRILYGSVEDLDTTVGVGGGGSSTTTRDTTVVWNRQRFETLRWKYHADFNKRDLNKQPKVIMDVAAFPPFNVSRKAFSIHRPSPHLCRMQAQMNVYEGHKYPLVVHHYLGSLERYLSRNDPRRTLALYHEKADIKDTKNENGWMDGWLDEFVAEHGIDKATTILSQYRAKGESNPVVPSHQHNHPVEKSNADDNNPNKPKALGKILSLDDDSLSACLLVKDDNDILSEWIAYHHHVLKLRTLIVAVDPSSKTSPARILQQWRKYMDDIQQWSDKDYMPDFFMKGNFDQVPNLVGNMTSNASTTSSSWGDEVFESKVQEDLIEINNHRYRQVSFLSKCIKYLKEQNKTWMIHIDTDEYVTLHPQVRNQEHWRQLTLNPTIQQFFLLRLLKDATREYSKGLSYPCVSMPRLLYGSKEDNDHHRNDTSSHSARFAKLPPGFNGTKFETLRWKFHSNYDDDPVLNGKPKAILDLSGLPPEALLLKDKIYSIHRPGLHLCKSDRKIRFDTPHRFPLTINHYIGSWERYSHRDDARRSRSVYNVKAQVDAGHDDDWIDGWVQSFVNEHGLTTARELLADYTTGGHTVEVNDKITPFSVHKKSNVSSSMEFSACLLVKDDNDILNEWIAYHYHVLGLRYMIVAIDAKSHTSPSTLLDRWRQFGMEIEEWTDEIFMPDIYFQKAYHLQPRLVKIKKNKEKWLEGIEDQQVKQDYYDAIQDHRFRQITFVASCIKKLRDLGRTWMIHIDTDEYVVINPLLRQTKTTADNSIIPVPQTAQASIIPRLLNEYAVTTNSSSSRLSYPCLSLPRLLYGSREDQNFNSIIVPRGYNHSRFETLRWKYHADYVDSSLNKQPKVIMDVAAIPASDTIFVENRVFSIHRPSQSLCRPQGEMFLTNTVEFPFVVNHYLGTFERFSARDDLRRNRKLYDQKANVQAGRDEDQWVDSWLSEFINIHGEEVVSNLLRDYRSDKR